MPTIDTDASFIQFLYPFTFEPKEFDARCAQADAACWPLPIKAKNGQPAYEEQSPVWEPDWFAAEDLLPYVERYLNPRSGMTATARLWKVSERILSSSSGLGCGPNNDNIQWQLFTSKNAAEAMITESNATNVADASKRIPFSIDGIKLSLFCNGIGFIAVCASPKSDVPSQWLDFVYHFRMTQGRGGVVVGATRQVWDEEQKAKRMVEFFPMPAGGVEAHPKGQGHFKFLLDALLQTLQLPMEQQQNEERMAMLVCAQQYEDNLRGQANQATNYKAKRDAEIEHRNAEAQLKSAQQALFWWSEPFVPGRMLPFSTLFVDNLSEAEKPLFLYRARKIFRSGQEVRPAAKDVSFDNPALLCYSEQQWFTFSLDGAAFVAYDAVQDGGFFRETLPDHLRDQYFLLFLIVLHQRFVLMRLSERVADNWPAISDAPETEDVRETLFREIRDSLLLFAARGNFVQVMQRENHHICYRKWQETFQIEALYNEVSDEVREMHNYLLIERTERIEKAQNAQRDLQEDNERKANERSERLQQHFSVLGLFVAMPALIISYLGINIKGFTSSEGIGVMEATLGGFGGGLVLAGIISVMLWWMNKLRS